VHCNASRSYFLWAAARAQGILSLAQGIRFPAPKESFPAPKGTFPAPKELFPRPRNFSRAQGTFPAPKESSPRPRKLSCAQGFSPAPKEISPRQRTLGHAQGDSPPPEERLVRRGGGLVRPRCVVCKRETAFVGQPGGTVGRGSRKIRPAHKDLVSGAQWFRSVHKDSECVARTVSSFQGQCQVHRNFFKCRAHKDFKCPVHKDFNCPARQDFKCPARSCFVVVAARGADFPAVPCFLIKHKGAVT